DLRTASGNVHTVLAFNPSHLEVVVPVVEGSVRARQERCGDERGARVLPLLVHGDAAFAGQGVVMETLQLSGARGFFTGGTVHVIINNQVGFTTSEPADLRSTMYCSDVAKMLEVPIFHVNTDDPEAVVFVTRLALKYRMRFRKDVVIDLVGYKYTVDWSAYAQVDCTEPVSTAVELPRLRSLGERITSYPKEFSLHPRVAQLIANRRRMLQGEQPLDWGCAETLAYAALVE